MRVWRGHLYKFSRLAAGLINNMYGSGGPIPLFRATLTIYRMALHFGVAILFAGRKNGEKGDDRKEKGSAERGFFELKNGMIEEVKHTGLNSEILLCCVGSNLFNG